MDRLDAITKAGLRVAGILTLAFVCVLCVHLWKDADAFRDTPATIAELHTTLKKVNAPKGFLDQTTQVVIGVQGAVKSVTATSDAARRNINAIGGSANEVVQKVAVTVDKVNAPCPANDNDKLHPCGFLADGAKTANTFRHTSGELEQTLFKFNAHEDTLFAQENTTWAKANLSIDHFNTILGDPNLAILEANMAKGSGTIDHMLFTADKVETKYSKCILHPTFACQVEAWILPSAQITGALLH